MAKLFSKTNSDTVSNSKVDTVIGPDSMFQGVLYLKNTVCVEGSFKGKIESKSAVIVGKSGLVEADIIADHVVINGEVTGSIVAYTQLDIGPSGKVKGDVEARVVTIEKGGLLQGFCHMLSGPEGEGDPTALPQSKQIEDPSSSESDEHLLDGLILPEGSEDESS